MMKYLQKLGKAIMLPVAVLPVAAIMMGIGYAMCPATMQGGDVTGIVQIIGFALVKIGSAVIDKLPMLFAVGVAIGLSKDQHGAAGLAGLVAFLTVTTVLNSGVVATMMNVEEAPLAFSKIDNAFIGIISGITASICYNRFSSAQLPTALAFFSGKRCVPIVTSFVMVAESAILYFVWPMLFNALVWVGEHIMGLGPVGAGLYAFANRLLIPTGLHHALNAVFWFDIAGIADYQQILGLRRRRNQGSYRYVPGRILPGNDVRPSGSCICNVPDSKAREEAVCGRYPDCRSSSILRIRRYRASGILLHVPGSRTVPCTRRSDRYFRSSSSRIPLDRRLLLQRRRNGLHLQLQASNGQPAIYAVSTGCCIRQLSTT